MFERFSRIKILMKTFICSTEDVLERIMDHRLVFFSYFSSRFHTNFWYKSSDLLAVRLVLLDFYIYLVPGVVPFLSAEQTKRLKRRLTGLHMCAHQHPVHRFRNGEILGYQAACKWLLFRTHNIETSVWNRHYITEKYLGTLFIWDIGEKQVVRRVFQPFNFRNV